MGDTPDAQQQFQQNLDKIFKRLLQIISGEVPDSENSAQTLDSAMTVLRIEATATKEFPKEKLFQVVTALLSDSRSQTVLIESFAEYISHPDIFSQVWKALLPISGKARALSETFALNFLELLSLLRFSKEMEQEVNFCGLDNKLFNYQHLRKLVNKVWDNVMLVKYTEKTLKSILIVLLENILPHLNKPLMLTDFLMESLEMGGTIALLALQGIFVLIQKHNLAFPDIYNRVYAMFEPSIFRLEYKTRLFQLADIFLSSTHLPEGLVAGFAKRLSRLALAAPAPDAIIICHFIGNLLIRHPGLKKLVHREKSSTVTQDPYLMDEPDPMLSRAIDSQLWEIHGLQNHLIPDVAKAASKVFKQLPDIEWDLTPFLEMDEKKMFDNEVEHSIESRFKYVAVAREAPKSILTPLEAELFDLLV